MIEVTHATSKAKLLLSEDHIAQIWPLKFGSEVTLSGDHYTVKVIESAEDVANLIYQAKEDPRPITRQEG